MARRPPKKRRIRRLVSRNTQKFLDLYHKTFYVWNQKRFFQRQPTKKHYFDGLRSAVQRPRAEKRTPNILITGGTDAATLNLVRSSLNRFGKQLPSKKRGKIEFVEVTHQALQRSMLDVHNAMKPETRTRNIPTTITMANSRQLPDRLRKGQHDAIVSDMFLIFFNKTGKKRVLRQWNKALRPGGEVLTTVAYKLPKKARKPLSLAPLKQRLQALKPRAKKLGLNPEKAIADILEYKLAEAKVKMAGGGSGFESIPDMKKAFREAGFNLEIVREKRENPLGFLVDQINGWGWFKVRLTKARNV